MAVTEEVLKQTIKALKDLLEGRAAAHEDATVKLRERMDESEKKAKDEKDIMSKIHKDQTNIIRELREQISKTDMYSKTLEEKMSGRKVEDENTPDWKKRTQGRTTKGTQGRRGCIHGMEA